MKKVNYRGCYTIPKFERAVIGHIAAGDCEQLEYDLDATKECLENTEAVLTKNLTDEAQTAANNTINALCGIIRKIGTIETVECAMCGDIVLKSACTDYGYKHICKSCECEMERQYYAMADNDPELACITAYLKENDLLPTSEEDIESRLVQEYEYAKRDNADSETMAWIYHKMQVELRRTFKNGKGILYAILTDDGIIGE